MSRSETWLTDGLWCLGSEASNIYLLEGDQEPMIVSGGMSYLVPRLLVKKGDAYGRTDWVLTPALTHEKAQMLCEKEPPCKAHRCKELGLPFR